MYDREIISDALTMMDATPGWRRALDKYRIDAVLTPVGTALAGQLADDNGWKLVDKDETHLLFRAGTH